MGALAEQQQRLIGVRERLGMPGTPIKRVSRQLVPPRPKVVPAKAADAPAVVMPIVPPKADVPRLPQWFRILQEVSEKHSVDVASLLSDARFLHIVAARNEAYWRMRNEITINHKPMSYPMIADKFGKDHASVIHGVHRHEEVLKAQAAGTDSPTINTPVSGGEKGVHGGLKSDYPGI